MVIDLQGRWSVDAGCEAIADHAQSPDLRADRWIGGGPDNVLARTVGWTAQLGLPLLLAARRHLDAARIHEHRILRGGARLARLAVARGCRQPQSNADHVRACRRAAADGARASVAAWIRAVFAGEDRQRCASPTPARRV